jgi:hypothetical protein
MILVNISNILAMRGWKIFLSSLSGGEEGQASSFIG